MNKFFTIFLLAFTLVGTANAAPMSQKVCTVTRLSWGGLSIEVPDSEKSQNYSITGDAKDVGFYISQAIADGSCDKIVIKTETSKKK
jgi:hypothetical protein